MLLRKDISPTTQEMEKVFEYDLTDVADVVADAADTTARDRWRAIQLLVALRGSPSSHTRVRTRSGRVGGRGA